MELGAFAVNRLRRAPVITLTAWNSPKVAPEPQQPKIDPLRIARYYQSLLDSGKFESRAALARFLGVTTFDAAGVLTSNKGLVVRLGSGQEFQITIVDSTR